MHHNYLISFLTHAPHTTENNNQLLDLKGKLFTAAISWNMHVKLLLSITEYIQFSAVPKLKFYIRLDRNLNDHPIYKWGFTKMK